MFPADFLGEKYTINETHKQYSLLDNCQENIYTQVPKNHYMSAGHVVGFLDFLIDVFLEVQNIRYS